MWSLRISPVFSLFLKNYLKIHFALNITGWRCQSNTAVPFNQQIQAFRYFWKDFTYSNFKIFGSLQQNLISDYSWFGDIRD